MDGWYRVILATKEGFIIHDDKKVLAFFKAMHSLMFYAKEIRPLFADPEGVQFLMKGDWPFNSLFEIPMEPVDALSHPARSLSILFLRFDTRLPLSLVRRNHNLSILFLRFNH